ncbi:FAD-binding oxidoreductase [Mesorhizobium waimense]|uniref:FAD-binding oxidoreductase n=1 Tax=Mesorhizobium waimense TaxID=1300307 RepID=A0A3A5K686_9HYPH|nr:FAD-binding oxidoreductase [Mesorhizobium waimense]RJT26112.1 FAD-binding oxidoreductase [Mesorhizobium waimense]
MDLLSNFRSMLGAANVLTGNDAAPYLTDWRGVYQGAAQCVVRPATTEQVAGIVALCANSEIPIVPQGGNTGLVGGATPDASGKAVVVSTSRLSRVRGFDPENNTVTVQAGCVLQTLQEYCRDRDRLFPLSLAAEGSCTIGGNLASNAGGSQVLRYGTIRELTLGLEVVTADGEIWNGLGGLRKDNTGYDLKSLFVGSEGTLGIITAATLKLFPLPRMTQTALVATNGMASCVQLLIRLQTQIGSSLTAFEVMANECLKLVTSQFPQQHLPFDGSSVDASWFALLELSGSQDREGLGECLETMLGDALEAGEICDANIATSVEQERAFWNLRESITLAQAKGGKGIKHDIALPISKIPEFVEEMGRNLSTTFPGLSVMPFGHLGDGNLHYNVGPSPRFAEDALQRSHDRIYVMVHDAVHALGGSISAEHGIGQLKRGELKRYKTAHELAMMRSIKAAFDPMNILNPGKVI